MHSQATLSLKRSPSIIVQIFGRFKKRHSWFRSSLLSNQCLFVPTDYQSCPDISLTGIICNSWTSEEIPSIVLMFVLSNGCQESCMPVSIGVFQMNHYEKPFVKIPLSGKVMNFPRFLLLALKITHNNINNQNKEKRHPTQMHLERRCPQSSCLLFPFRLSYVQVPLPSRSTASSEEGRKDSQSHASRSTLLLPYWIIRLTRTWCLRGNFPMSPTLINFINLIPYSITSHLPCIMTPMVNRSMI